MNRIKSWRLLSIVILSVGVLLTSCNDSSVSGVDEGENFSTNSELGKAKSNLQTPTINSSVLFEDDFESNSISNYTLGAFGPSSGSATVSGGEIMVNGNFVKSFAPNVNFTGSQVNSENGFSICMDVSPLSARPGGNNNAVRLSVSMGHESINDAVTGFDGNANDGYVRLRGFLGEAVLGSTIAEYDANPAFGNSYTFTLTVETDEISNGTPYTAILYMDAIEIGSFSGEWDSDNNYIGIHAIDGNWSIDNLVINSSIESPCLPSTSTNLFVSDGSVRTWDPLYPDANDNQYFDWPANICVETPEFGLNVNWINEKNAFVIDDVATFETFNGYGFDAEWINAWNSLLSSESGGPSFGGWNNVSWSKYSTTVNGDAGEYVVQFLADNCSWIFLDGVQIGYQDSNFLNSGNNGKYPVTLSGEDQELSFVIFDGGGQAGGKFRLETLTSFIENGGDEDDLGTPTQTNEGPTADAGADQTIDATGQTTSVTLDGSGSTDPDGDQLTYSWVLNGTEVSTSASYTTDLADGNYIFALTVFDGEETDFDDVSVSVINTVPTVSVGTDITIEATGTITSVTLNATATDADGDALTYSWSNGARESSTTVDLEVGSHTFTLNVSDGQGASDTDEITITITDTTAPTVSFNTETNSLWPPNHKMVLVLSGIQAEDVVDGMTDVNITVESSEDANGNGDGNTDEDFELQRNLDGSYDVYLRAERSGNGSSRTYTVNMISTDDAGNSSVVNTIEASVPHDKSKKKGYNN
jgi:hypothetical protein